MNADGFPPPIGLQAAHDMQQQMIQRPRPRPTPRPSLPRAPVPYGGKSRRSRRYNKSRRTRRHIKSRR